MKAILILLAVGVIASGCGGSESTPARSTRKEQTPSQIALRNFVNCAAPEDAFDAFEREMDTPPSYYVSWEDPVFGRIQVTLVFTDNEAAARDLASQKANDMTIVRRAGVAVAWSVRATSNRLRNGQVAFDLQNLVGCSLPPRDYD